MIVLSSFHPPHREQVNTIMRITGGLPSPRLWVLSHRDDVIPATRRVIWLKELFPGSSVDTVTCEQLINDEATVLFKNIKTIWLADTGGHLKALKEKLPAEKVRLLMHDDDLTEAQIYFNTDKYLNELPTPVRPEFVKRVVLFGPESTGKSTLAKALAQELNTVCVPEFARNYLDLKKAFYDSGGPSSSEICEPGDIPSIVLGQAASEDALAEQARRILICDTNCLETFVYSTHYFGKEEEWLNTFIASRPYHLYLLTHTDIPWVPDPPHRDRPEQREEMFDLFKQELVKRNLPYVDVRGNFDMRKQIALEAISGLMSK